MDSFKRWSENQYAVEELCLYLQEKDISALCCVSKAWRKALNINPVWARIVTARGIFNQSLISRVNEDLGDSRVKDDPGDYRVKEDLGDSRVSENPGDSRVNEDLGDYRVNEDLGDSRVSEKPGDSRVKEDLGDSRVSENPGDSRVNEDLGDSRVKDDPGDYKVTEFSGDLKSFEDPGDSRVTKDSRDNRGSDNPGDYRGADDPGDSRVNEDLGDSRVTEVTGDYRVTKDSRDTRGSDNPGDYRGAEDPGDSRVNEDLGDSRVKNDPGDYIVTENPGDYGGSEDPGDYIDSENSQSLEPSCYWARVLQYSAKLRHRWRNGEGVKTSFLIPECVKSSKIACFDADPDFLAVGTETGYLLVFSTKSKQLQYTNIVKQSKIEKLYVRHSKIVAVQFGLIQVYNISSELNFIFCKSIESQTQRSENSLDPFHVPKVSIQQMRSRYGRNGDVDISKLDLTVSAIGDQTLGLVKSGETSFYVYSLETGDCMSRVESEKDEKILKIELVHVPGI